MTDVFSKMIADCGPAGGMATILRESATVSKTFANTYEAILLGFYSSDKTVVPQYDYSSTAGQVAKYKDILVMLVNVSRLSGGAIKMRDGVLYTTVQVSAPTDGSVSAYIKEHLDELASNTYTGTFDLKSYYDPTSETGLAESVETPLYESMVVKVRVWKNELRNLVHLTAGDTIILKNASFSQWVFIPEDKGKGKRTAAPAAATTPDDGTAAAVDETSAGSGGNGGHTIEPIVLTSIKVADGVVKSENNFAGALIDKIRDRLEPEAHVLRMPTSHMDEYGFILKLDRFPLDPAAQPKAGPSVLRSIIVPCEEDAYLKPPMGMSKEETPVREPFMRRTVQQLQYRTSALDELKNKQALPYIVEIALYKEKTSKLGITRIEDWRTIGGRFPWIGYLVLKVDLKNTLGCEANRGDTAKRTGFAGVIKTHVQVVEWDLLASFQQYAVEVSPQFVFDKYADVCGTMTRPDGSVVTMLAIDNENKEGDKPVPNPLHVRKAASPIINLDEYTGEVGAIVANSRIFAVTNYEWSFPDLERLRAMTNDERGKVLSQMPDAPLQLPADTQLSWILYAVQNPVSTAAGLSAGGRGKAAPAAANKAGAKKR
jgi:hypothetical protein